MSSRVMQAWDAVKRDAVASDYDDQQLALFQIGLVLQRHNPHITPDTDMEDEALSRELLRLSLNTQRQQDTVDYLAELVRRKPGTADSFLYAMSNAQPELLVKPLVSLIQDQHQQWDNEAIFQALLALNACLNTGDDDTLDTITNAPIRSILETWETDEDDLISEKAASLLRKIDRLSE